METVDAEWAEEQLAAAEAEIEQQKKEWEMERLAIERADERLKRLDDDTEDDDMHLMYSSEDSKNQVNDISHSKIKTKKTKTKLKANARKSAVESESDTKIEVKKRKKAKTLTNLKYKSKLRRSRGDTPNESNNASTSVSAATPGLTSKLKVEAIRLEHLHLLSDNEDSELITRSLVQIKKRSMKDSN